MQNRFYIFLSAALCAAVLYLWPWAIQKKAQRLEAEAAKARKTYTSEQVRARSIASLRIFPVKGHSTEDIISGFGDPRAGGLRRHEGVDIRAERGTPVLAVADGIIHRVKEGGNGGRQIWLELDNGWQIYYAHLHAQLVTEGQRVSAGDLIGTVGNTGNARKAGPHLHFCIYPERNKPVDPMLHLPDPDMPS